MIKTVAPVENPPAWLLAAQADLEELRPTAKRTLQAVMDGEYDAKVAHSAQAAAHNVYLNIERLGRLLASMTAATGENTSEPEPEPVADTRTADQVMADQAEQFLQFRSRKQGAGA
jgi:hypothetical protein